MPLYLHTSTEDQSQKDDVRTTTRIIDTLEQGIELFDDGEYTLFHLEDVDDTSRRVVYFRFKRFPCGRCGTPLIYKSNPLNDVSWGVIREPYVWPFKVYRSEKNGVYANWNTLDVCSDCFEQCPENRRVK